MTPGKREIVSCAKSIVRTCNLNSGDGVAILGGVHTMDLLEEIALECYKKGSTPTIVVTSDKYLQRVFREIPARTLATVPKQLIGMLKACDMMIAVEEHDDSSIAERFPRDKLEARQKANHPIGKLLNHPTKGKKWLFAGWPTRKTAKKFGVSFSEFSEIIIGGISVSPDRLMKIGKQMSRKFADASWIHVWDSKGTDFRVKVDDRMANIDDGIISQEDYDAGDRGANLPAGELFFAPHETVGEGTLFCPITKDRLSGKIVKDVMLEFKDGALLLDRVTASENLDALLSSFEQCQRVDRIKFKTVRTKNLAELGIGFNPKIKKAIGYILTDEKVMGTVHVAFGLNKSFGGKSESTMHWDFVSAPGVSIEVTRSDGKIVPVMSKGRLI